MALALVVAAGCGKTDAPRQLASGQPEIQKKQATPKVKEPDKRQAALTFKQPDKGPATARLKEGSAEAYYAEWRDNNVAAGEKYTGKVFELTGEIRTIERTSITLKGTDEPTAYVRCNLAEEVPVAKLGHGQTVKVRGALQKPPPGFTVAIDPTLVDCKLVEFGPNPEKPLTAAALSKEFAADEDKTVEKYGRRGLALEGEITTMAGRVIHLKGGRRTKEIRCYLYENQAPLKVGQRVRVLGQFDRSPADFVPEMHGCLVVVLPDRPAPPPDKPASIALPGAGANLANAKLGDYVTYALTAKFDHNPETGNIEEYTALEVPIRHVVAGRNDGEVTFKSVMRAPGGWDERPRKMPFKVDLTQPREVGALLQLGNTWATQEEVPVKLVPSGTGQEKIKIGTKTYECDWAAARVISEDDDEVEVKIWFSKAVPVTGLARLEAKAKTRRAVFSSIAMDFVESGDQAAADAQAAAVQKEIDKLKGVWRIESIDVPDGAKMPAEDLQKLKTVKVVISENTMTWSSPEEKRPWEQPFWLDPGQKPKNMTITLPSQQLGRPTQFNKAIYALDGDTLKICLSAPNKPRPTQFKIDKETGARVITYKREKP